jgi:hypothetical protein
VSAAIAEGDMGAINYFVAQQYVKALQALASAPNQKVFMMPVEAASVIGTLGGIAEIARSAFPDGPPPGTPRPAPRSPTVPRSGGAPPPPPPLTPGA